MLIILQNYIANLKPGFLWGNTNYRKLVYFRNPESLMHCCSSLIAVVLQQKPTKGRQVLMWLQSCSYHWENLLVAFISLFSVLFFSPSSLLPPFSLLSLSPQGVSKHFGSRKDARRVTIQYHVWYVRRVCLFTCLKSLYHPLFSSPLFSLPLLPPSSPPPLLPPSFSFPHPLISLRPWHLRTRNKESPRYLHLQGQEPAH